MHILVNLLDALLGVNNEKEEKKKNIRVEQHDCLSSLTHLFGNKFSYPIFLSFFHKT